jgi:hypothetical protein
MGGSERVASGAVDLARRVAQLGGTYSAELGIDLRDGEEEVARWFLASTLFGTRIAAGIVERTFRVLDRAGVSVAAARGISWDRLVDLLDAGGYTRYDYRTATRLQDLSEALDSRYAGAVCGIEASVATPSDLEAALDALPGWGPVTVGVFLRELRGVWALADPALGEPALAAGRHLGLLARRGEKARLQAVAGAAGMDVPDLECALVRLTLAHRRTMAGCPGGRRCRVLADPAAGPVSAQA